MTFEDGAFETLLVELAASRRRLADHDGEIDRLCVVLTSARYCIGNGLSGTVDKSYLASVDLRGKKNKKLKCMIFLF